MTGKSTVRVRRVYDEAERGDGTRVLVDGMWPRGVRKAELEHDEWLRDVAPSAGLRRWFGHDPDRFDRFARRYRAELGHDPGRTALDRLRDLAGEGRLTLLTATRDTGHSHAAVLAYMLNG